MGADGLGGEEATSLPRRRPPRAAAPPPAAHPRPRPASPAPRSGLGISERVLGNLLGRLAAHGVVEEVDPSGSPTAYRLLPSAVPPQQRRGGGGRRSNGMQPKVGSGRGPSQGNHQVRGAAMGGLRFGPLRQLARGPAVL